ncbi:hypothetical protein E2C01_085520 [Portunus trituberculatus]|uniref:Uncharacterized protein n=1 Tax=Portunus trituberculatus TaxID=210409 RepID=A0A5B7J6Y5_PORTR|nr:hypothetical protein [Portunus trituberculatus]
MLALPLLLPNTAHNTASPHTSHTPQPPRSPHPPHALAAAHMAGRGGREGGREGSRSIAMCTKPAMFGLRLSFSVHNNNVRPLQCSYRVILQVHLKFITS